MDIPTEDVLKGLRELASLYAVSEPGKWLQDFPWKSIPVNLKTLPKDVCGMYFMGRICLMNCGEASALFPIYVHELRHRWQRVTNPVRYFLGKIYRPLIERDADREENAASEWLDNRSLLRLREWMEI